MQDSNSAKMSVLDKIIEMMVGHQLGGLKKKGAPAEHPAVASLEVHAEPADLADKGPGDDVTPDSDESPDLMQKLAEMYGKDDDEEKDSLAK